MKAVVLYFLSLFFLLIGGMDCTHASVQQRRIYHARVSFSHDGPVITKHLGIRKSGEEMTYVEDDDIDFAFVRKQMPTVKCLTVPSYTMAFRYYSNRSRNRSTLYKYVAFSISPKYIIQRVLKI